MRRVVAGSRPALRPASSHAGRRITARPTCPRRSRPRQFAVTVAARLSDSDPPTHSSQRAQVPLSSRGNRSRLAATCRSPSKPGRTAQLLARLNSAAGDATGDPAALRRGDSAGSRAPCPSTWSLAGRWRGRRDLHPMTSPEADRRSDARGAGIGCSGLLHNRVADHAASSAKSRKTRAVRPPASLRVPVFGCSEPLCLPCYTVPPISCSTDIESPTAHQRP